jgi:hypothetical protein
MLGAGYGLYATRLIPPSMPLFTIPASALPNVLTLASHYPGSDQALTAVQLISLHLALHRPKAGECSSDPLFGAYISVLPEDFAFHPLTWLRKRVLGTLSVDHEKSLLNALPISVMKKLKDASAKFETDWKRVSDYLVCLYYSTARAIGNSHSREATPDYMSALIEVVLKMSRMRCNSCGLG